MEDAEIALMFSLLAIPVAIWLQLWVKNRKNVLGEEEFESTARAFLSIVLEGTAIVGGLIMIIMGSGGVIKYIINFYTA